VTNPSLPVVTTLATPLVGPPTGEVAGILAVTDDILSTTFSLATIEPFTAPAITPAMIKRMKIDRQIVHLLSALVLSFPYLSLTTAHSIPSTPPCRETGQGVRERVGSQKWGSVVGGTTGEEQLNSLSNIPWHSVTTSSS